MSATQIFLDSLRAEIKNLPLYNAGVSSEYVRSNYHIQEIAKLGSNENSHGTSPNALAQRLNVNRDRLVLGNGSDDLIAVAVQTFLSPGDDVVTVAPSYGLHLI